jgi:hypothetical protein
MAGMITPFREFIPIAGSRGDPVEETSVIEASIDQAPTSSRAIPSTLQASLMARIDRLGFATKQVAQVAAAIRREFSFELLTASGQLPASVMGDGLERLTATFTGKLLIVSYSAHNICTEMICRFQCLFLHSKATCKGRAKIEARITPPALSASCAPVFSYLSGGRIS